jgi:type III secretory pathway component EscS
MDLTPQAGLLQLFWMVLLGSGPSLVIAAAAGLVIAILQGVMQIQDQTLPQVVKTGATMFVLFLFGGLSFGPVYRTAVTYFEMIAAIGR